MSLGMRYHVLMYIKSVTVYAGLSSLSANSALVLMFVYLLSSEAVTRSHLVRIRRRVQGKSSDGRPCPRALLFTVGTRNLSGRQVLRLSTSPPPTLQGHRDLVVALPAPGSPVGSRLWTLNFPRQRHPRAASHLQLDP